MPKRSRILSLTESDCRGASRFSMAFLAVFLLVLVAARLSAEPAPSTAARTAGGLKGAVMRVAILDFAVQSDQASWKYLGKGFAELVSVDLAKAPGIRIIEREKRNDLLEEMAFSLTDAADPAKAVAVGKLLAAD